MDVYLFSSHHDLARIEVECSEHNLFGTLPTGGRGKYRYCAQVGDRVQRFESDERFDYWKTLIENIY